MLARSRSTAGVPIWTDAPLDDLIVEDGRVVGVRHRAGGHTGSGSEPVRACCWPPAASPTTARCAQSYGGDQPNRAKWSIANPGDTGEALADRHAARRQDRPDGRGVVAAVAANRPVRAIDARPGPPATPHDLRRRDRPSVRERVELVHGSRQGDVRPRQDQPGRPVLADLRRPLPQALRAPALAPRSLPEEAARERPAEAGLDARRPGPHVRHRPRRARPRRSSASTRTPPRASTPTTAEASRPTTGRWATRTARCIPCLGPIDEPPYYAVRVVPGDIGTCGGLVDRRTRTSARSGGEPIEGLYATGNGTATVMGRHYLGPGASIANTMVFGYLAARHATRRATRTG